MMILHKTLNFDENHKSRDIIKIEFSRSHQIINRGQTSFVIQMIVFYV